MNLDAKVNNQITRNDYPMILACNRQLATILPVRLKDKSADYVAGTVLGRITATGLYTDYDNGNSDGTEVAAAVLFEDVKQEELPASGTAVARGIFGGEVFLSLLTGYDSGAGTDLKARTIIDASGVSILKF